MAPDRLDAIVIGASVDGLVAAAVLAKAGRSVVVVEREADLLRASSGKDAVVSLDTVRALDLTAHGLRFAAPPPVAAITGDRALVLWPDLHASRMAHRRVLAARRRSARRLPRAHRAPPRGTRAPADRAG